MARVGWALAAAWHQLSEFSLQLGEPIFDFRFFGFVCAKRNALSLEQRFNECVGIADNRVCRTGVHQAIQPQNCSHGLTGYQQNDEL